MVKARWKYITHEIRYIERRWRQRGVTDATAEPEWSVFEDLLYFQAETVFKYSPRRALIN